MIDLISSLVNVAKKRGLADYESGKPPIDPAFQQRKISWFIDLDDAGKVVQASSTTGKYDDDKENKSFVTRRGKTYSVPARYQLGALNAQPDDFLYGKYENWFQKEGDSPVVWDRINQATKSPELKDSHHLAVLRTFLNTHPTRERMDRELGKVKPTAGEYISFRVDGIVLFNLPAVRQWWSKIHRQERAKRQSQFTCGRDFFQEGEGKLTDSFPSIPVGRGIPLASFDKAPFSSYGLSGGTTGMRVDTAEKATAALSNLIKSRDSSITIGDLRFLFWAAGEASGETLNMAVSFISVLEVPDSLFVRDYLEGIFGGGQTDLDGDFHCVVLTTPQGRFAVRSLHTATLAGVRTAISRWYYATRLGKNDVFGPRMRDLALCLVRRPDRGARKARCRERTIMTS